MKIYQLYRRQVLKLSQQQAWDFFSSPYYLNEITPDFFNVEIVSKVPAKIYAGLMISYRMKAVWGLPMGCYLKSVIVKNRIALFISKLWGRLSFGAMKFV